MRWMSAAAAVHRGVIIGKNEPLLIQPGPFLPEFFFMNILSSNCSDCKNAIYLKFGGLINWLIMAKIWKIMANRYSEHKMIISYWAGGQLGNRFAIGAVLVWFPTRRYTVRYREVGVPHRSNFQVPVPCGTAIIFTLYWNKILGQKV